MNKYQRKKAKKTKYKPIEDYDRSSVLESRIIHYDMPPLYDNPYFCKLMREYLNCTVIKNRIKMKHHRNKKWRKWKGK